MELEETRVVENYINIDEVDVKGDNPKSLFTLGKELVKFADSKKALGVAAPQVGIRTQAMCFLDLDGAYIIAFNPRYYPMGSRVQMKEGCLTYPGKHFRIKRYKKIRAKYWTFSEDKKLFERTVVMKGDQAVIFQHETDHCQNMTLAKTGKEIKENS